MKFNPLPKKTLENIYNKILTKARHFLHRPLFNRIKRIKTLQPQLEGVCVVCCFLFVCVCCVCVGGGEGGRGWRWGSNNNTLKSHDDIDNCSELGFLDVKHLLRKPPVCAILQKNLGWTMSLYNRFLLTLG